jgi:hypothetical protein
MELPKTSDDETTAKTDDPNPTLVNFANALVATILCIAIGGVITVFGTIFVLEAIHTKNLIVDLIVVSMTVSAGAVTAIALRRTMLTTKN